MMTVAEARPRPVKLIRPSNVKRPTLEVSPTTDSELGNADRVIGREHANLVAFTFDDGPNPETTPTVIAALKKYDLPATFFIVSRKIVGERGAKYREVLAREIEAGFTIASHSFSHKKLLGATPARLSLEIDEAVRLLAATSGRAISMFRAPYGKMDRNGRGWLKKRGLTEVFWSVDPRDWEARDGELLRKKIFREIVEESGGVVLMHDVKPITAKIVAEVFDDLEAENCKRIAANREPILPVSIHYFLRDNNRPRSIPPEVKKQTDAYRSGLAVRCRMRSASPPKLDIRTANTGTPSTPAR